MPIANVRPPDFWEKAETVFLVLLCGSLMFFNVPAQWTGIATDPGFTAWVAPISNRLHAGPRLYEWGTHMPLPPLTHVLLHLVSFGKATWLTESFAHHLATSLTILLLYFYLKNVLPRHVSFLGAVAATATFNNCETILFYNSFSNFLVACLAVTASVYYRCERDPARASRNSRAWLWLLLMGFISAALMLSKQSIGGLSAIGCAAVVACAPAGGLFSRIRSLFIYGLSSAICFGVICLLMLPWVNPKGLLLDVFINGSQCKGGTAEILGKIGGCAEYVMSLFGISFATVIAFTSLGLNRAWLGKDAGPLDSKELLPLRTAKMLGWSGIFCFLALAIMMGKHKNFSIGFGMVQTVGLGVCVFSMATIVMPSMPSVSIWPGFRKEPWPTLGCLAFVLIGGATGYSLSGVMLSRTLNWNGHTIPLLQLAMAGLFWLILLAVKSLGAEWPKKLQAGFILTVAGAITLLCWWGWRGHAETLVACKDRWNDCAWYQGAKVIDSAESLHAFVTRVNALAGSKDKVLLLPEDPNLAECFNSPRPDLSCAIIYTDQYWPKYIDQDLNYLTANAPKLLIIGPEKTWRAYGEDRNENNATEKFIDALGTNVIPRLYHLEFRQTIHYLRGEDTLAVYARNG